MSMIKIQQLSKIFSSDNRAVDKLDLEVAEGEILGLLGPNGAGKTTTVRVLSTLSGFDSGKVNVAGYDIDTDPDKIRHAIGYVAQQTGVDFFLSGRENLRLQGHMYHMKSKDIDRRIDELAGYFELGDYLDRLVKFYSGGVRRKLDIATALIHNPRLLFLDEPTLGLDIHSRHNLWQLIRRLNQENGLTILLTTHYLDEADKLAHRVAIINKGKIEVCDTPEALKGQITGEAVVLGFSEKNAQTQTFAEALKSRDFVKDLLWEQDKLHLYVENGAKAIADIAAEAGQYDVQIATIVLAKPTLDDVFLKYTGTSMEQNETEEEEPWWAQWAGKGGGSWGKKWSQWEDEEGEGDKQQSGEWSKDQQEDWKKWQQGDQSNAGESSQSGGGDWQKWQQSGQSDAAESDESGGDDRQKWQSTSQPSNTEQEGRTRPDDSKDEKGK